MLAPFGPPAIKSLATALGITKFNRVQVCKVTLNLVYISTYEYNGIILALLFNVVTINASIKLLLIS